MCASQARFSDAAFTARESNPNNSLSAASLVHRNIASGTYTGNGVDNRNITGLGFQPDIVIIKAKPHPGTVIRTRTMTGDGSKPLFGATALVDQPHPGPAGRRLSGRNRRHREHERHDLPVVCRHDQPGLVSIGSYTGNGLASRTISGPGYSPDALICSAPAPTRRCCGSRQ